MNKTTKLLVAVAVVVAIAVGAIVLTGGNDQKDTGTNNSSNDSRDAVAETITYDGSGFSPDSLTVSSGAKITFVNQSDDEVEPSSDPHPTHTTNPELNVGSIAPGESKTITVTSKGAWGMHNHFNKDQRANITVE